MFLHFPVLTARLSLNFLTKSHSPELFSARQESYTELSQWGILIWTAFADMTMEENDRFIQMKQDQLATHSDMTIVALDRKTGRLIGGGGLHKCNWDKREFFLGYWVRTSETGKGYATEIANALISYAFNELSAQKLLSSHGQGNRGSQKILESSGFQLDRISKGTYPLQDGSKIDDYHYSLTL